MGKACSTALTSCLGIIEMSFSFFGGLLPSGIGSNLSYSAKCFVFSSHVPRNMSVQFVMIPGNHGNHFFLFTLNARLYFLLVH